MFTVKILQSKIIDSLIQETFIEKLNKIYMVIIIVQYHQVYLRTTMIEIGFMSFLNRCFYMSLHAWKSWQRTAESKTVRNLSDDFMFWGNFANFIIE